MDKFDICIVGAGVIGLAIARQLIQFNRKRQPSIVILERESGFGQHTSSRNSEVVHAGIYYQPGSLKALLCVRGKQLLYEHCAANQIECKRIGKFIVAQQDQVEALQLLAENAGCNGVDDLRWQTQAQLNVAEPAIRAHSALFSPSTGIIDSHRFMQSLLFQAQNAGVEFAPYTRVETIEYQNPDFTVTSLIGRGPDQQSYQFQASILINSAGLLATEVAARISPSLPVPVPEIHLCKGDYFAYLSRSPIRHLVYPLPEENTVGLGIHATLDLTGQLRFGPDSQYTDRIRYDVDPGKADLFAQAISAYFPAVAADKLIPAYAGIRPKLMPAGSPPQDFQIQNGQDFAMPGLIQLFGIESPGLTASLAIGEHVRALVTELGV